LAGQRVIYSFAGLTVPDALLRAIGAGEAGGVIFFGENIASDEQLAAVVRQLQQAQGPVPAPLPLLLMTDQEGGLVRRLSGAPEQSAKQIGQAADPAAAASAAGAAAGQRLAGVGLNMNLAPVLDVYRQAGDFLDQYQRSFSRDPATVAACGSAFIAAQQQAGVVAVAKHFPGLGAATAAQNTDLRPVTLSVPLATLQSVDAVPYPPAITAGIRAIMLSWAVYPALDASAPAGLSAAVVRGVLRGQLGFRGVTITDALEAGALGAYGDAGQRAVLAARAGMDLILCSARDAGQGQAVTAALADALENGRLDAAEFAAAVDRVAALRSSLAPSRFFPETGQTVGQPFLAYWESHGGLAINGYPLSGEFTEVLEDGQEYTVQYFERVRMEHHPENAPPYDILLGQFGRRIVAETPDAPTTPVPPQDGYTYFAETGHNVGPRFGAFWRANGGLAQFGYPLSELFEQRLEDGNVYLVQYFERARFELHPENQPPYDVLLGQFGRRILDER
jgi:beta-N-acetylhexosaminidase